MQSTIGTATATTEVLMLTIFMIFPVQEFTAFAQQSGLFVTCGSDFHGKHKPSISFGGHGATWCDEDILS